MANELDEVTGPVNAGGRDIHVIDKQIPVKVGFGSLLFEIPSGSAESFRASSSSS